MDTRARTSLNHLTSQYDADSPFSLQVNDLSNLLLGIRLAPLLLKTAKANGTVSRLVNVSSEAMYLTQIDSVIAESKGNIYKAMSDKDYCVPP